MPQQTLATDPNELALDRSQPRVGDRQLDALEAPGPRGEHDFRSCPLEGLSSEASSPHRSNAASPLDDALDSHSTQHLSAELLDRALQTHDQPTRVDLVIPADPESREDATREVGLDLPQTLAVDTLDLESLAAEDLFDSLQLLAIIAVDRHQQGALGKVADPHARDPFHAGHELRVAIETLETQSDDLRLVHLRFGDRGQHPSRGPGGTATRAISLQHRDLSSPAQKFVGQRQSDDAGSDDNGFGRSDFVRHGPSPASARPAARRRLRLSHRGQRFLAKRKERVDRSAA
jgi:hypothetical protein